MVTENTCRQNLILIAEDERPVRRFIRSVLYGAGYATIEAGNGFEAKTLLEFRHEPVLLAICDIRMPGLGGLDLAADLNAASPGVPVLYISGLIDSIAVQGLLLSKPSVILTKPFTAEALIERVQMLTCPGIARNCPRGASGSIGLRRKGPGTAWARFTPRRHRAS